MSTRCQVKVKEVGNSDPMEAFTLYHHCDGYPSAMVPLLAGAYQPDWKHGRIGKAASFILAEDPDGYELEQGHELHGDIEWYYVVSIDSDTHVNAVPRWYLNVYEVTDYENVRVEDMKLVFAGLIQDAVPLAIKMEGE